MLHAQPNEHHPGDVILITAGVIVLILAILMSLGCGSDGNNQNGKQVPEKESPPFPKLVG